MTDLRADPDSVRSLDADPGDPQHDDGPRGGPAPVTGRKRTTVMVRIITPLVVFVGALSLRLWNIVPSYELFIDEVTYALIAGNVAGGDGVTLHGHPFLIHPPLSYLAMGGALRLLDSEASVIDTVWLLRPYVAVWGALGVVATYAVVNVLAGARTALIAAVLLALDPFTIRFDSRVMMEAEAQVFVLLAVLALLAAVRARGAWSSRISVAGAGVAAGTAMCVKETFGLVAIGLLALLVLSGWAIRRRAAAQALALALAVYAVNCAVLIATAGFQPWWAARTTGLSRLIGTHQITGFNAPSTEVSLASRVAVNLDQFSSSYVVLVFGGIAAGLLVRQAWIRHRRTGVAAGSVAEKARVVVAAWSVSACGYVGYATLLGSIEEQMYYIALTPCIVALVIAVRDLAVGSGDLVTRVVVLLGLSILIAGNALVWQATHSSTDNTYDRFMRWAPDGIPPDSVVSVTDLSTQFLLDHVRFGMWVTPEELAENDVDYVLVVSSLVDQGYSVADPEFVSYLDRHAPAVFEAEGRSAGWLRVYDVRELTGGAE